jgi:hypothetical protein
MKNVVRFMNGRPENCQNPHCGEPFKDEYGHKGTDGRYYCNDWCEEAATDGEPMSALS